MRSGRSARPGVVPYRLMWARSSFTSSGGLGMVRVSWTARCFRPRSCRAATRPVVYRGQPNRIQTSGSGRCEFRACRISFSCCVYPGAAMLIQVPRSGARIAVPCHGQTREGRMARPRGGRTAQQGRHSFRAACSAPRRRACRPALSAGRPARSAGSPGRARPAGLAGRSASARRPGRSRGGASDEPLGNLTAILRICRAGVRRLLPWRLRCRGIAPGRSGVPGLRRSCRPLA